MPADEVRKLYPNFRTTPLYEGRDPRTGKTVTVGGDTLIPAMLDVGPGLPVGATLAFDASDRLRSLELWPDLAPGATVDPKLLHRGAQELAARLGLGELPDLPDRRDWMVGGAKVALTNEDGFRFELSRPQK
jgi:hypothetical protein